MLTEKNKKKNKMNIELRLNEKVVKMRSDFDVTGDLLVRNIHL